MKTIKAVITIIFCIFFINTQSMQQKQNNNPQTPYTYDQEQYSITVGHYKKPPSSLSVTHKQTGKEYQLQGNTHDIFSLLIKNDYIFASCSDKIHIWDLQKKHAGFGIKTVATIMHALLGVQPIITIVCDYKPGNLALSKNKKKLLVYKPGTNRIVKKIMLPKEIYNRIIIKKKKR